MVARIAIVLARGGSKRLPRKNILEFFGKPMVAWTIHAALESHQFDRVLVSTDDDDIAHIARSHGAEVPFLRDAAADDMATSSEATLVALKQAERYWGEQYDTVAQLMANCPLRDSSDITQAMSNFDAGPSASQISCFRFGWMNPWWALKLDNEGRGERLHPEIGSARSQDLPRLHCPTGALWVAHTGALKEARTFATADCAYQPMSWISAMDIDDEEDLEMARACYLIKHQKTGL